MVGKLFCGECGTKMKNPDVQACPKCGSDPSRPTKSCPNCGKPKASPNAIVCTFCGSALRTSPLPKDPGIAALVAVLCMLLLGAPGVGYIYLGNVRKGIIYILFSWVVWVIGAIGASLCCFPILIPLIFDLLIVWDVYLEAKGEETKLPGFE